MSKKRKKDSHRTVRQTVRLSDLNVCNFYKQAAKELHLE